MEDAPRNQYTIENLTRDQERALIRRAQAGDNDARNRMVENFMPYVVSLITSGFLQVFTLSSCQTI